MPDALYLVVVTPVLPDRATPAVFSSYIMLGSSTGTHTHSFPLLDASEITNPLFHCGPPDASHFAVSVFTG